ncbi:MAG: hypothetical protein RQ885_05070 [Desulfurococcales archaeon]|nr:hypothetical protein [Desulfurococcales archaeon]
MKLSFGSYNARIEIPAKGSATLDTDFVVHRPAFEDIFYKIISGSGFSIKLKIYMYRNTMLGTIEKIREVMFKL